MLARDTHSVNRCLSGLSFLHLLRACEHQGEREAMQESSAVSRGLAWSPAPSGARCRPPPRITQVLGGQRTPRHLPVKGFVVPEANLARRCLP